MAEQSEEATDQFEEFLGQFRESPDKTRETPNINAHRPSLMERAERRRRWKRRRGYKAKPTRTAGRERGFFGVLFRGVRLLVLVVAGIAVGIYVDRSFLRPVARVSRMPSPVKESRASSNLVDSGYPGGETYEQFYARTISDIDWDYADKLIVPTRELLDRLERAEKDLSQLKKYLENSERDNTFNESRFLYGSDGRMVALWLKRKSYKFPVPTGELEKWRAKFNDIVKWSKIDLARYDDPAHYDDRSSLFKIYASAAKAMELELERGFFVIPRTPTGPEEVVADLTRVKDAVDNR